MLTLLANAASFTPPQIDFYELIPIAILGFLVAATLCLELKDDDSPVIEDGGVPHRPTVLSLGAISLVALLGYYLSYKGGSVGLTFNGMLYSDILARGAGVLITLCALLAILAGPDELEYHRNKRGGEFCALIFASSLGMIMMASAANTMVIFLGLELFSIALYLLCIFFPDRETSRESGMKYFILSSAASAVMLYGFALLYGATGSTWIYEMRASGPADSNLYLIGIVLVVCGLLFKLAIAPFHFWAPDVYQGAPTTVTAFMSVATKVAALTALWRFVDLLGQQGPGEVVNLVLISLSALSILLGNFMALAQKNVKRMLAYSGVANAGYLLIAPAIWIDMKNAMMLFLATYLVGNVGAFLAVAQAEAYCGKELERSDLRGLFQRQPWLAGSLALCLVSLTGLPPAAGFMGKFYLFGQAIATGRLALPLIGIVGSLLGAGYYIGTAIQLFSAPEEGSEESQIGQEPSTVALTALGLCCAGVVVLGFAPNLFLNWFAGGF